MTTHHPRLRRYMNGRRANASSCRSAQPDCWPPLSRRRYGHYPLTCHAYRTAKPTDDQPTLRCRHSVGRLCAPPLEMKLNLLPRRHCDWKVTYPARCRVLMRIGCSSGRDTSRRSLRSSSGSKTVRMTKNAIAEIDRSRRGKRPLLSSPSHVSTTVSSSTTEKEAG